MSQHVEYALAAADGFFNGQVFVLDRAFATVNYLSKLLSMGPGTIKSKGGKVLPTEIWLQIIELAEKAANKGDDHMHCLVDACLADFKQTRGERIIRCTKLDFDVEDGAMVPSTPDSGCRDRVETAGQVDALYLLPKFREVPGRDNIFYLFVQPKPTPAATAAAAVKSGLLWNNSHLDVYYRVIVGGGVCWVCQGTRFVCPCEPCTAQSRELWSIIPLRRAAIHINPPAFCLVCPHCMNKIPQVAPKEEERGCPARLARPYSKTIALATNLSFMHGAAWSYNGLSRLRIEWDVFEWYVIIPELENFPREM